jgi:hypothetical protein
MARGPYRVEILPAVFSLDEEGKSVALDVDADPDLLAQAADACPRAAITLVPRAGGGGTSRAQARDPSGRGGLRPAKHPSTKTSESSTRA